ncbi:extracellular solute-binding protein [Paenibacillus thalictri]|uniref:Extracellular solute-binding protein n=1 Tax=Paenibacillus thalictri TaxID=2527873 RepID=A0A4V2J4W7_9BACL|nr:extracellular solute-binding protein [Paenibacillus thalictri]TBL81512.1 extracellular solute-binding protein [Paenibacillus thalictri]
MNKKVVSKSSFVVLSMMLLAACNTQPAPPAPPAAPSPPVAKMDLKSEDVKGTVTEWNWNAQFPAYEKETLGKKFPNLKFEATVVATGDYLQKLQSSIASGTDVPDIILAEIGTRGKLYNMDILENLEAPPYNFDRKTFFPYEVPLHMNEKGQIVGVEQQLTTSGFAFRRDLTKQFFGVDDPDKVEEVVKDWDAFIKAGQLVKEKSGGQVYMMASLTDALTALRGQTAQEYIKGDEIDITKRLKNAFEIAFKLRDTGILGKYEQGSPAWNAAYAKGDVIFWNSATFSPKSGMYANDKEKGTGRWGLVKAPGGGFTMGGTSVGIYKNSKNKEAAWEVIKYLYLSKEGFSNTYREFGYIPGVQSFFEGADTPIDQPGRYDEFFGGQNLAKYHITKILPGVKGQPQSKYETIVNEAIGKLQPQFIQQANMTPQQALDKIKDEIKLKAPNAIVK